MLFDSLLSLPFILLVALFGTAIGLAVEAILNGGISLDDLSDSAAFPASVLVFSGLAQQLGQVLWPWIVSKWQGFGMKKDWWFSFRWIDLLWGLIAAGLALAVAYAVSLMTTELLGLEDAGASDNTGYLTDNSDSWWLIGIIFMVVIGAPLSEELLFRGLIMQGLLRIGGPILAVIGSSLFFMLPHIPTSDFSWDGTAVLWATIFSVGVVLAIVTLLTKRLGAAIFAHVLFNTFGVGASLLADSESAFALF